MRTLPSLLSVTLVLGVAGPAAATAVYDFDGAPGGSDDIHVTIELPAPLAAGLSGADISASIGTWFASEGGSSLDHLDAEILAAVVSTDSGGNISQWLFHFRESDEGLQPGPGLLANLRSSARNGFGSLLGCGVSCTEIRTESGPAPASTSSWTLTPVPEPSTAALLVAGLSLLATRRRRS
ncbi:MAG: PEP-CTERM sorting domain-containing protein [Myxococcota bacterium]|nr:PEP-CTERM sorting domain-containing protein [Myxococcota bacterium]